MDFSLIITARTKITSKTSAILLCTLQGWKGLISVQERASEYGKTTMHHVEIKNKWWKCHLTVDYHLNQSLATPLLSVVILWNKIVWKVNLMEDKDFLDYKLKPLREREGEMLNRDMQHTCASKNTYVEILLCLYRECFLQWWKKWHFGNSLKDGEWVEKYFSLFDHFFSVLIVKMSMPVYPKGEDSFVFFENRREKNWQSGPTMILNETWCQKKALRCWTLFATGMDWALCTAWWLCFWLA